MGPGLGKIVTTYNKGQSILFFSNSLEFSFCIPHAKNFLGYENILTGQVNALILETA